MGLLAKGYNLLVRALAECIMYDLCDVQRGLALLKQGQLPARPCSDGGALDLAMRCSDFIALPTLPRC